MCKTVRGAGTGGADGGRGAGERLQRARFVSEIKLNTVFMNACLKGLQREEHVALVTEKTTIT